MMVVMMSKMSKMSMMIMSIIVGQTTKMMLAMFQLHSAVLTGGRVE